MDTQLWDFDSTLPCSRLSGNPSHQIIIITTITISIIATIIRKWIPRVMDADPKATTKVGKSTLAHVHMYGSGGLKVNIVSTSQRCSNSSCSNRDINSHINILLPEISFPFLFRATVDCIVNSCDVFFCLYLCKNLNFVGLEVASSSLQVWWIMARVEGRCLLQLPQWSRSTQI